jgi:hypothetical protein
VVDQRLDRHRMAGGERQHRQDAALLRRPEVDGFARRAVQLDRPEEQEPQVSHAVSIPLVARLVPVKVPHRAAGESRS